MIRIRRAHKNDATAIGRVHVETWQATYAGLLPNAMLAGMSDVRQSAYWSRVLSDPREPELAERRMRQHIGATHHLAAAPGSTAVPLSQEA